ARVEPEVGRLELDHALEAVGGGNARGHEGRVHGIQHGNLERRRLGLAHGHGHEWHDVPFARVLPSWPVTSAASEAAARRIARSSPTTARTAASSMYMSRRRRALATSRSIRIRMAVSLGNVVDNAMVGAEYIFVKRIVLISSISDIH